MVASLMKKIVGIGLTASCCALLSGCGVSLGTQGGSTELPGVVIEGRVHGGAFPIQGATISLMETQVGATLNGGNASTYTSAAKLLETQTSDSYGYFTFDTNWTCTSGQYAYMTVTSGHTSNGPNNNNVVQVGVIGSCDMLNTNVAKTNVYISELSTIAAAYALRNFISISPNDGSGRQQVNISAPPVNLANGSCSGTGNAMTCTGAGIANGFANALNLVDSVHFDGTFPSGAANTTLKGNTQAVIPQALINTMGNILQSCVDSSGVNSSSSISGTASDGTRCGDLFEYATPPGTNATSPSNTLQAALNFATYPNNNVDALYRLQPRAVFFTPTLASDSIGTSSTCYSSSASCISLSLGIFYTGNGMTDSNGNKHTIATPVSVALDAADNAYVLYTDVQGTRSSYVALSSFNAAGAGIFADQQTNYGTNPASIAPDNLGNVWVTLDDGTGLVGAVSSSTGQITQYFQVPNAYPAGLALDRSNNVWVSRDSTDGNQSIFEYVAGTNGYTSTTFANTPKIGSGIRNLAFTTRENLYGVTSPASGVSQAIRFPYGTIGANATVATASLGSNGGNALFIGQTMAPNGGQEAFFPAKGELDSSSAPNDVINVGSAGTYTSATALSAPAGGAIDGAGNLFWTNNATTGLLYRLTLATGNGATSGTSLNNGTLTSYFPCYVTAATGYNCDLPSGGTNLRGLAIDDSGTVWILASDADFTVAQIFGAASPSYPLLSYSHTGQAVQ